MYTNIEQRACDLAVYIIENKATVRSAAREFGISKSTVHKDLTERLPRVHPRWACHPSEIPRRGCGVKINRQEQKLLPRFKTYSKKRDGL